jgi:hypothetical protein
MDDMTASTNATLPGLIEQDRHRELAASLQHRVAARIIGLQTAGPEVFIPPLPRGRLRNPAARASREPNHELTFALDQSLGADQKGGDFF